MDFSQLSDGDKVYYVLMGGLALWALAEIIKGLIAIYKRELDIHIENKYVQYTIYLYFEKATFIGFLLVLHGCIIGMMLIMNITKSFPSVTIAGSYFDYSVIEYRIMVAFFAVLVTWIGAQVILFIANSLSDRSTNY